MVTLRPSLPLFALFAAGVTLVHDEGVSGVLGETVVLAASADLAQGFKPEPYLWMDTWHGDAISAAWPGLTVPS